MRVIETSQEMALASRQADRPLGLVPTMGALHPGHLALVMQARRENQILAVSIFVNPSQFGAGEGLESYPKDLDSDLGMLEREGVDLVFTPTALEIYPPGFDTWVEPGRVASKLEGADRPGHFRGVATVVAKLISIIRPDRAYFGQKDGQQTIVIRQVVRDLALGSEVVVVPTVRGSDGLAFSSRVRSLTAKERLAAPVMYEALCAVRRLWETGERNAELMRTEMRRILGTRAVPVRVHYVSVADGLTLDELEEAIPGAMVSVAASFGSTRLIDNIILR